jgi:glycosyltransferase involved in cell wall biosynthesis
MVSIITPHYNRSALLKEAVASVLHQTSDDWELIIVDDGSDENEFDSIKLLADQDHRITILKRQSRHKGPSACRNEGVAASKGEYLVFLDSDDALAPYCVEQRKKKMDENKHLDMGVFLMEEFNSKPGDNKKIYNNNSTNENRINNFLEGNNPWAVTCPVWRKDFFLKCGGFDENFFYMEDPELHVRALLHDGMLYKTFYDYPADCYYRVNFHDDTKINFYENSIRYRVMFYKKTGLLISDRPGLLAQYKKSFERGVVNFFSNFLLSRVKEFPQLQQEFIQWANRSNLLSGVTLLKFKMLSAIFRNDNSFFRKIRLKGLASKLLMPVQ